MACRLRQGCSAIAKAPETALRQQHPHFLKPACFFRRSLGYTLGLHRTAGGVPDALSEHYVANWLSGAERPLLLPSPSQTCRLPPGSIIQLKWICFRAKQAPCSTAITSQEAPHDLRHATTVTGNHHSNDPHNLHTLATIQEWEAMTTDNNKAMELPSNVCPLEGLQAEADQRDICGLSRVLVVTHTPLAICMISSSTVRLVLTL